jgi:hypothetical protein
VRRDEGEWRQQADVPLAKSFPPDIRRGDPFHIDFE